MRGSRWSVGTGLSILMLIGASTSLIASGFVIPRSMSGRGASTCFSRETYINREYLVSDRQSTNNSQRCSASIEREESDLDREYLVDSDRRSNNIQRFFASASVAIGMALVIFSGPLPYANAGFGPSSRAVVSPVPGLVAPRVQDKDLLSDKKLKQLIGSANAGDENRLEEFSIQLNNLADALSSIISSDDDTIEERMDAKKKNEDQIEQTRVLQQQIASRTSLLAKLEKQPYWFNYLAAFVGSVASTLVMHPIDTIKTRLQVNQSRLRVKVSPDDDDEDDEEESEEGGIVSIASLYEGLSGNILKEGPPSALYLGVYESAKILLMPQLPQNVLLVYLISGAAGEMCGSIIRAPAEAIKSTVQSGISSSAVDAATKLFGSPESRTNVVRAWSASIWRDVPFGAIQLAIFELTKTYILNNPDIDFDSSTLLAEACIGAFAGGWGALLTNPFDIITTRIITQEVEGDNKPLGVIEMGQKLYEEGGWSVFFVGWQARVGYWAPAISIFLTTYCSVRQAGIANGWFSG